MDQEKISMTENNPVVEKFENDYRELMRGFLQPETPFMQNSQWKSLNDFIPKFTLYQEIPNGIVSTETSITFQG